MPPAHGQWESDVGKQIRCLWRSFVVILASEPVQRLSEAVRHGRGAFSGLTGPVHQNIRLEVSRQLGTRGCRRRAQASAKLALPFGPAPLLLLEPACCGKPYLGSWRVLTQKLGAILRVVVRWEAQSVVLVLRAVCHIACEASVHRQLLLGDGGFYQAY